MIKSALLTSIREMLHETTANLWTDTNLYNFADAEIRSLPRKRIYKEELYTTTQVVNQVDYQLPTNVFKVDKVEQNEGTADDPSWEELAGWDTYGDTLYLGAKPTVARTMRLHLQVPYLTVSSLSAGQTIDIPDSKVEVVVLGAVLRAYQSLMGYFVDLKNWDYVGKPDGITMRDVNAWIRDVKIEHMDAIRYYRSVPRPRFIDLT